MDRRLDPHMCQICVNPECEEQILRNKVWEKDLDHLKRELREGLQRRACPRQGWAPVVSLGGGAAESVSPVPRPVAV